MVQQWLQDNIASAAALRAAYETTLLRSLCSGPATVEEHAARAGTEARATALLFNVLVNLEIVLRDGDRFSLTPAFSEALNAMPAGVDFLFGLWGHLTSFVKTGVPWMAMNNVDQREQQYRQVVGGLARMFEGEARRLAAELMRAYGPFHEILDIGCGSGVWGLAVAHESPAARITGLDLPAVLDVFAERAAQHGMAQRATRLPGDMHVTELLPDHYDLVIIANVLRLELPQRAASLIHRASRALRPGGRLVVIDALANGTPERERARAIYALHLALRTKDTAVHSPDSIEGWMREAGLEIGSRIALDGNLGALGIVQAQKNQSAKT